MRKKVLFLTSLFAAALVTVAVAQNKEGNKTCPKAKTECVCTDKKACAEKKCDSACCTEAGKCQQACDKSAKADCKKECPKK